MKVATVHGVGDLRLDEADRPTVGPDDLVVKVAAAGICGTDLHFRSMGPRFPDKPMPLGHEFAGEVVEIGANVKRFKVGQRVAYDSYNSPSDTGRGGAAGGFSAYVAFRGVDTQAQSLCTVPDNVSLEHAALVEPLSVAEHAVNRANSKPGETAAVFGVGPIGLGIVIALRAVGIDDVVAFDPSPLRRQRAIALGARAALDPRRTPPAEVLRELRGTGSLFGRTYPKTDMYFEASGADGLLADVAGFCNKGSRIITVALQRHPTTFDGTRIMSKEISIIGASGYPTEFAQVMAKVSTGAIHPEMMITHRFPFAEFASAFEIASNADGAAKVLLTFE
jgi:2-desacetyl-2-hydroxyethyl bacteriochlorophyllide A dehydrogenase